MIAKSSESVRWAIIALSLLGVWWWAAATASSARRVALRAADDVTELQRMSRAILGAASRPRVASLDAEPPDRIASRVERAMTAAGVAFTSLASVQPQAATRVNQTAYLIRPTLISLENVTMRQTIEFCLALENQEEGLVVRDLNVSSRVARTITRARPSDASGERWDATLTLTQMIFSPANGR